MNTLQWFRVSAKITYDKSKHSYVYFIEASSYTEVERQAKNYINDRFDESAEIDFKIVITKIATVSAKSSENKYVKINISSIIADKRVTTICIEPLELSFAAVVARVQAENLPEGDITGAVEIEIDDIIRKGDYTVEF